MNELFAGLTYDSGWDIVAAVLIVLGCSLTAVAGLGLLRFPDVLSRMHAATKPQVLGLFLSLAGLAFVWKSWVWIPVLILAWLLQLITAPVSAHLVGRATYRSKHLDAHHLYVDELAQVVTLADSEETEEREEKLSPRSSLDS